MIIAKCKRTEYNTYDGFGIVAAIMKKRDGQEFYFVYAKDFFYPQQFKHENIELLSDVQPEDWVTVSYADYDLTSFSEWANDQYFYGYLVDDYNPDATSRANGILSKKLSEYLDAYAINKYGSIKAAKEHILRKRYEEKLKLQTERGYEKPDDLEINDSALSQVELDINDLMK